MNRVEGKSKKKGQIVLAILLLIVVLIGFGFYSSRHMLTVSHYTIELDDIRESIRIVHLTDLHNSVFGKENKRLLACVEAEKPDLIFLTGDLLNQNDPNTEIALDLIRNLMKIAPVYASFGNHEIVHEQNFGTDMRKLFSDAGAVVLEYDYTEIKLKEQELRIGGLYGYCVPPTESNRWKKQKDYLSEFQDTDTTALLLCHIPVSWIQNTSLNDWDVDVVFAGHAHGGQIRIPFVGGLWAPDQGWFPGRECGLYFSKDKSSVLVLSRGLGSNNRIPRFNNVPEIVVVDLIHQNIGIEK